MTLSRYVIDIENLKFRYAPSSDNCLDISEFKVEAGERIFLYGPSGSGKSTLLGLLGGVLTATEGSVKILGNELTTMHSTQRDRLRADHIGYIFQQFNLIPYLTVIDNVLLPCKFSDRRCRQTCIDASLDSEAQRLLSHLDIKPDLWKRPVTSLSVGQQQRVAAARALIGRPEVIIADEPTSALDADRQVAFLDLLLRECADAKSTLLFVSHDHRLASAFSREVALVQLNQAAIQETQV